MIPVTQDVKITFEDVANSFVTTRKDVVCYFEDNTKLLIDDKRNTAVAIGSTEEAKTLCGTNSELYNFAQTFFAQEKRPNGFTAVFSSGVESGARVVGTPVASWGDLIEALKVGDTGVKSLRLSTEENGIKKSYLVDSSILSALNLKNSEANYIAIANKLTSQNGGAVEFEYRTAGVGVNYIAATTVATGSAVTLSLFETEEQTEDVDGVLLTANVGGWSAFKAAHGNGSGGYNNAQFKFTEDCPTISVDVSGLNSFDEFAGKVNEKITGKGCTCSVFEGSFIFTSKATNAHPCTYLTDVEGAPVNTATLLKGTSDEAVSLFAGAKGVETADGATLLGLSGTANAKAFAGTDDISELPAYISRFADICSRYNVRPNIVTFSRSITSTELGGTDVAKTINMINGFLANYSASDSTNSVLLVVDSTVKEAPADENGNVYPFANISSRNVVINYVETSSIYLDACVSAYCAFVNWDGTNSVRNLKGLHFNNLKTSYADRGIDDYLNANRANIYATMTNGVSMYRNGLTTSGGTIPYIDLTIGVNALTIDLEDALFNLLLRSTAKLTQAGASLVYSVLANVCEKYVKNGFLSDTTIDGVSIPAYKIKVANEFTREDIQNRRAPAISIEICGTQFVNKFTVNVKNAY